MLLVRPCDGEMWDIAEGLLMDETQAVEKIIGLLAARALRQSLLFSHLTSQHPESMPGDLSALWGYGYARRSMTVKVRDV